MDSQKQHEANTELINRMKEELSFLSGLLNEGADERMKKLTKELAELKEKYATLECNFIQLRETGKSDEFSN